MSKKISKSQLSLFIGKPVKEKMRYGKKRASKKGIVPAYANETGATQSGWYPEMAAAEEKNAKKIKKGKRQSGRGSNIPEVTALQSGSADIMDIITPASVDLFHRDYVAVDGVFFAYLYLTGYGYSTTVGNGWLNPLIEAGEGINLIFTVNKQPKDKTLSKISQATMINRSRICDQNGIMLGINQHNRSVCIVDIFDSVKYSNANMAIMGMSGAGKTFLLQLMALRFREQGVQVFIIAPLKGHEFRPACEAINGKYIKLSPSSGDCINIMDIRRISLDTDMELGSSREDSLLADKIQKLHIFFMLLKPNITDEERHYLDTSLIDCYARRGITHDNGSLFNEDGSFKEMPVLKDLYELLEAHPEAKNLALSVSRFVTGSAKRLGQSTNVDLENKYIVLDISEMSKDLLPLGMFLALDYCWDKCKESRIRKKVLMLDELWCLSTGDI